MEKTFKLAKGWADVPADLHDEWLILHRCKKLILHWNFKNNDLCFWYARFEKPGMPDEIEKSLARW